MKAFVYQGPGKKFLEERPKPEIMAPTDAIVRVTKTTICGTDLHILKGDVARCKPGRILGHEGAGVIEQLGSAGTAFMPGDHVLISCIRHAENAFIAAGRFFKIVPPYRDNGNFFRQYLSRQLTRLLPGCGRRFLPYRAPCPRQEAVPRLCCRGRGSEPDRWKS